MSFLRVRWIAFSIVLDFYRTFSWLEVIDIELQLGW